MFKNKNILLTSGLLCLTSIAITGCENTHKTTSSEQQQHRSVHVTGQANITTVPDEVSVILGIEKRGMQLQSIQKDHAKVMSQVMKNLIDIGIAEEEIETTSYTVRQETSWNKTTQQTEFKGFLVTQQIKLTTTNIEKIGNIIDTGIEAGANQVHSIRFHLTEETQQKISSQLLTQAAHTAQRKAKILASALDKEIGPVLEIEESNYHIQPSYVEPTTAKALRSDMQPETVISPKSVETSATVRVRFSL